MTIKDDLLNRRQMYIDTKCRINNDLDKLIKDCDDKLKALSYQHYEEYPRDRHKK
jgi:hypothetical protein